MQGIQRNLRANLLNWPIFRLAILVFSTGQGYAKRIYCNMIVYKSKLVNSSVSEGDSICSSIGIMNLRNEMGMPSKM